MKKQALLVMLALFLIAGSAFALTDIDGNRVSGSALTKFTCAYERSCVKVSWDGPAGSDFNNFRVITEGPSAATTTDRNFGANDKSKYYCTVAPGETFSAIGYRYSQDAFGNYHLSPEPDNNCTVTTGSEMQGAQYLIYNTFVAIGSIIVVLAMIAAAVLILAKFKLKLF